MNIKQSVLLIMLVAIIGVEAKYPNTATGINAAVRDANAAMAAINEAIASNIEFDKGLPNAVAGIISELRGMKQIRLADKLNSDLGKILDRLRTREIGELKATIADLHKKLKAKVAQLAKERKAYNAANEEEQQARMSLNNATEALNSLTFERDRTAVELASDIATPEKRERLQSDLATYETAVKAAGSKVEHATTVVIEAENKEAAASDSLSKTIEEAIPAVGKEIVKLVDDSQSGKQNTERLLQSPDTAALTANVTLPQNADQILAFALNDKYSDLREELVRLAAPARGRSNEYALWVVAKAAQQDGQKWAKDALLSASVPVSGWVIDEDDKRSVGIVRKHDPVALDALLSIAKEVPSAKDVPLLTREWAIHEIIKLIDQSYPAPYLDYLKLFVQQQADAGGKKYQQYLIEKAVYAAWNYDSTVWWKDYGIWALCALRDSALNNKEWAVNAINKMVNGELTMFEYKQGSPVKVSEGYNFLYKPLNVAIKSSSSLYRLPNVIAYKDQIVKWAGQYVSTACEKVCESYGQARQAAAKKLIDIKFPEKPAAKSMQEIGIKMPKLPQVVESFLESSSSNEPARSYTLEEQQEARRALSKWLKANGGERAINALSTSVKSVLEFSGLLPKPEYEYNEPSSSEPYYGHDPESHQMGKEEASSSQPAEQAPEPIGGNPFFE